MFLIRFISKYFIQNLDEKDLAKAFERSNFVTAAPSPSSQNGIPAGHNEVNHDIKVLPVSNGVVSSSIISAYVSAVVDVLIKSPLGYKLTKFLVDLSIFDSFLWIQGSFLSV